MNLSERLRKSIPVNDKATEVRRTMYDLMAQEGDLKDARVRLLESGAFELSEALLSLIDGITFFYTEEMWHPDGKKSLGEDNIKRPDAAIITLEWDRENYIVDYDMDEMFQESHSMRWLNIVAPSMGEDVVVSSRWVGRYWVKEGAFRRLEAIEMSKSNFFRQTLSRDYWRDPEVLQGVVIDALVMAGITQSQLRPNK